MRPTEIDDKEIIAAGQQLVSSGRTVTGFAIRALVKVGRPDRLFSVWENHLKDQANAHVVEVAELPLDLAEDVANASKEIGERLQALATQMNDRAIKAAERRVIDVQRASAELRDRTDRELADASETLEDLEANLEARQGEISELQEALRKEQTDRQGLAVQLATLRERNTSLEDALAKARTQVRLLEEDVEVANNSLTAKGLELAGLAERLNATEGNVADGLVLIEGLRTERDAAHTHVTQLEGDLRHVREESTARISELERASAAATQREVEAKQLADQTMGRLEATERHREELMTMLKNAATRKGDADASTAETPPPAPTGTRRRKSP